MYDRPLCPVPRSSIPTWTPSPCSAAITRRAIVRFSSGWRSVTSRSTWLSAIGDSPKIAATSSTIASSAKCSAERLKPILKCGLAAMASPASTQTRRISARVSSTISPLELGERNELHRRHQRPVVPAPAHQNLGTDDARGRQIDDRLVVGNELAIVNGARKLGDRIAARTPRAESHQRKDQRRARTRAERRHHDEIGMACEARARAASRS